MFHRFQHESEYYPALTRLPLDVRRKLDLVGIKIALKDWLAFSLEERAVLCHLPTESPEEQHVFHAYLDFLTRKYLGLPVQRTEPMSVSLWNGETVPESVRLKSAEFSTAVTSEEWVQWHHFERYALYKTATSSNQPEAFPQVLEDLRGRRKRQSKAGD